MLSNPPTAALHGRSRQHRRQNSTPTAYRTVKIAPNLAKIQPSPAYAQQQPQGARVSHRRGMSLDTRRQMLTQRRQEFNVVSNTNNTALENTPQHVEREAQQQRIARPGPQQAYANLATDQNFLVSPGATPHIPCFDPQWSDDLSSPSDMSMVFGLYGGSMDAILKKSQDSYASDLSSPEFDMFIASGLSTPTLGGFEENPMATAPWMSDGEEANSRKGPRRISIGIMDRVNKFENLGHGSAQRPITPPQQNEPEYFPLTPTETPQSETFKHVQLPQRFSENYDESNEETVKPLRQRANRRSQTVFDEMRQQTEALTIVPEPRRADTMPTDGTMNPAPTAVMEYLATTRRDAGTLHIDNNSDGYQAPSYPVSESSGYSREMSPATPGMGGLGMFDFIKAELDTQMESNDMHSDTSSLHSAGKKPGKATRHRRTESIASLASAASIASIDIESTKMTTGITLEDIQQYIQGPDSKDNKWMCVFENCNKKFGRKENIKSHIQTHLNDRQYKCPECSKCFVRQHDLKRHAKIHTGIKPYPCACGNSFARHDALTRHRQRGMCIGAFEGSSPKNAKRGRPRKPRPDDFERREKAARTRRMNKSTASVSSQATSSDYSAASSPEDYNDFDMIDEIMDVSLGGTTMNPSSLQSHGSSTAPMPSLPRDDAPRGHSPSAASVHSQASQLSKVTFHTASAAETISPRPGSPAVSVSTPANDPPELSHVASPPANQYFDMEPGSNDLDLIISSAPDMATIPSLMSMAPNENGLLLECEPPMLMFGSEAKFDDSYDGVDLFTNNDDLVFGHS
ncbi:hypothetical protein F4861DRAFT_520067 [Xylaria intraflava]|nr:hypothetical protein F4861DRAFT_520067 [Xylaria intraflava]